MSREKLTGHETSTMEILVKMAEGNPGGIVAMTALLKGNTEATGLALILKLDEMNIRGSQIHVGFKDHCNQDVEHFIKSIIDGDQMMIDTINRECYIPDLVEKYGEAYSQKAIRGESHA